MQIISLADVLHHMDTTAEPFDLVYSTADRQRRTGGELVHLTGCLATSTNREQAPGGAAPAGGDVPARKPAHRVHQTRNVTILSSGKPRKLHVRLLTEFNGQKVRW